ncbi:ROK family protein [Leucobacter massiliensis]|uniref:ROK family protein n=1 Tax=Leucobacter massiliensis TaxID=1686285 RepID=UPI0015E2EA52|nr:ROK family protein [Leucobacter massiliensis]
MSEQPQHSNDRVRRSNLVAVLRALHLDGAQSRAQLTRRTGLYRSTIAALVAELIERDLVAESLPETRVGVGRPSPIVTINPRVVAISVYPDVDALIGGVVGLGGTIHRRWRKPLTAKPTPEDAVELIAEAVSQVESELGRDHRIIGLGVALPALVDTDAGSVTLAPNLDWHGVPFAQMLRDRLGISAMIANDAQLGATAEREFGSASGVGNMIYLNGSGGGIGGGAFVDGREMRGFRGYGAEFGHIVIDHGGEACFCGQHGCFERCVRRDALVAALGVDSIDDEELGELLAGSDDPLVLGEVARQVDRLAAGISMLISVFAPERVVLGGFLASLYAARREELVRLVAERSFTLLADRVEIVSGGLGSREVLLGAAERVFEGLFADPARFRSARADSE